ncbi:MAG TPA: acyl-CoA dehydrogenase family protein [Acidimicrobiales bacterium]|nr:acyl-CoA dehydrogenase family protein [Acidimicrobiales bacterium]
MAVTEDVRTEVRAWLDDNWDPDLTVAEWWQRLADSGWGHPTWPEEHSGRGLGRPEANAIGKEITEAGALGPPGGLGTMLAGPTILAHGTDEQKKRFLPTIANGQEAWCQLFSEPNAGSDLAGLQTRAVRDGDEWVVNGQKVWTSGGQHADLGMLIARTDPDAPKHRGITYFGIPMHQPGIEVRPLVEMTGRALFNEVFLDDARVHDDARIGELGQGWAVANTTLMNERASLGGGGGSSATSLALPGTVAGHLEKRAGDFVKRSKGASGTASILAGRSTDVLMALVKELGKVEDPLIRQDLMRLYSMDQISSWGVQRAKVGQASPALPNLAKLMMSSMTRLARDLGLRIVGPSGTLTGPDTPGHGAIQELALFSPAPSIYGGTDEVQRNIIGERVLGLPKEPGPDKDTPFSELLKN